MWTITINDRNPVTLDTEEVGWESLVNAINANPELNAWLTAMWVRLGAGAPDTMVLSNSAHCIVRVKMVNDQWTQEWEEFWAGSLDGNPTAHQSVSEDGVYELTFCLSCTPTVAYTAGEPTDIVGPPGGLTVSDTMSATYSYNGSPAKTITFSGSSTKSSVLMDLGAAINFDAGVDLFSFGNLSSGKQFVIFSLPAGLFGIYGGNGLEESAPADLVLSLTPGADYDAVAILYGSEITIHSCGPQVGPGLQ